MPANDIHDAYRAVDELVGKLSNAGQTRLANILNHQMHKVAWTTSSELLEELMKVLETALLPNAEPLPDKLRQHVESVLREVRTYSKRSS